jgi:hypothetical protein
MDVESYSNIIGATLNDIETVIRIAALVVAAAWAYMKFVRGRVFYSRLEPEVSGNAIVEKGQATLAISIKIKNIGLSRVDIRQSGSGLRILSAVPCIPQKMISAEWQHLGTFPVLESHAWIEPGETVGEDRLVILPKEASHNLLLEMNVVSGKMVWIIKRIVAIKTVRER